jgi:hypothetical protein
MSAQGPDSPPRSPSVPPTFWATLAAIAVGGVGVAYGATLFGELAYDDYFLTRPWRWIELERVWHGTWDPTRISVRFYRPITAWMYAGRFELFGLHGVPQHALSLLGMATCAVLAGLFVWRETENRRAATLTTLIYAIHPSMAYAQAAWLTNQMHLLASLLTLAALLAWQYARRRGPVAWLAVLALQCVAFGVKEDTVMIAPAIIGLTLARRWWKGDIAWPSWSVWGAAAMTPFVLFWFRYRALGRVGGYGGSPGVEAAWINYSRAFTIFTLEPARRPLQMLATATSQIILVGGGLAVLLRRESRYLILVGLWIAAVFNAPFVLVSKAEQFHLIAFGASVVLAAACDALIGWWPVAAARRLATMAALAALATFVPLSRHIAADFAPCSAITLGTDEIARGWPVVPPEIKAWLADKPARCAAGALVPLTRGVDTVTWAFWSEPAEDGGAFQWTGPEATVMARRALRQVVVELRRPGASPGQPVAVTIDGPAGTIVESIADGDWHSVTVPLSPSLRAWLRDMHRIDLAITPTFVPSQLDRRSNDNRRLGVQLRVRAAD